VGRATVGAAGGTGSTIAARARQDQPAIGQTRTTPPAGPRPPTAAHQVLARNGPV